MLFHVSPWKVKADTPRSRADQVSVTTDMPLIKSQKTNTVREDDNNGDGSKALSEGKYASQTDM